MENIWRCVILALGLFFCWQLFKRLKNQPELFEKKALSQSLSTMGFLALFLIGAVTFLVFLVR